MGNQCTSRCRSTASSFPNPLPNLNEAIFTQTKAITDTRNVSYPLSINGLRIVDSFDRRIKLSFVTLRGLQTNMFCLDVLEDQNLDQICSRFKQLGFNGVKVLYSIEMVVRNPIVKEKHLGANEHLFHKNALNVLDIVVNRLTRHGLMVVFSNYSLSSKKSFKPDVQQGLWWSNKYSQYQWLDAHKHLVQRYRHNPRVIGFQLKTFIKGNSKYNPTWGDGSVLTDWKRAAESCINEIHAINKHCLVFVGGLNYGCDLRDVADSLIRDTRCENKIVYSGCFWISRWNVLSWKMYKYEYFVEELKQMLMCVRSRGCPVWIQFPFEQLTPFNFIVQHLFQSDLDWCFSSFTTFKNCVSNIHQKSIFHILDKLSEIQESTVEGQEEWERQDVVAATLPKYMIASHQVEVMGEGGYNVDELLNSTPEDSEEEGIRRLMTDRERQQKSEQRILYQENVTDVKIDNDIKINI